MKKILKNKYTTLYYLIIVLFFIFLCYLFPYTGDDWAWGSEIGINRLNNFFMAYNGRYLGNIMVLILTRSNIIKTIVMAFTLVAIIYFGARIVNKKIQFQFIMLLFLLAIPINILRQSIVWTSGFSNYVISTLLILLYIYLTKDIFIKYKPAKSKWMIFSYFLLAFISSFFVENLTIYNILVSLGIIIYSYIKYKKISFNNISYFVGSICGALIMFSNSAYYNIINNTDNYRTLANGIFEILNRAYVNYFKIIYKNLIFNNILINISITVLLMISVYNFFKNNKNINRKNKQVIQFFLMTNILYTAYSFIKFMYPAWQILLKYTYMFEGLFSVTFLMGILIVTFFTVQEKVKKEKLLFYLFSILIMTLPLLFVTPIGPRNFFSAYIMFIIFIIEFINYLVPEKLLLNIAKISIVFSIMFAIYLLSIYLYVFIKNYERDAYIYNQSQITNDIVIPKLPYEQYLWTSTPQKDTIWETRYKLFHNINPEVKFSVISYKTWVEKYKKKNN